MLAAKKSQGPTTPADAPRGGWSAAVATGQPFALDLRSLALFRVALGALALADAMQRCSDLQAHYTDWGVLPRGALLAYFSGAAGVCLHLVGGTAICAMALFVLHMAAAVGLMLGWRSRTMAAIAWFLTYSVHLRNPLVLQGGDDLLRMLMFWGAFLPLGARYSVDAGLHQRPGVGGGCHIGEPMTDAPAAPNTLCNVATVAMCAQMVLMYRCTALLKTAPAWHEAGTAVSHALQYDLLATPLGIWLRQFKSILPLCTHVAYGLELATPFLLLCPLAFGPVRTATCVVLIGMHHCFALCLTLGLFPWVDMVSLLVLLPGWFWDRLSARINWKRQKEVIIYYDDTCTFCKKLVQIIRQFLCLPHVRVMPAQAQADVHALMLATDAWVIQTTRVQNDGGRYTAWPAFVVLARVSPVLGPIASLLSCRPCMRAGQWGYRQVASRRGALSVISRRWAPWQTVPQASEAWQQLLCAAALCGVVAFNSEVLTGGQIKLPSTARTWAIAWRLNQRWDMFSPTPATEDGWFVVPGTLSDGTPYDVLHHRAGAALLDKPRVVSATFDNQRWRKYMMNLYASELAAYRLNYGQYLCRKINGDGPRPDRYLAHFDIIFMREDTLADGTSAPPRKMVLWRHHC